MQHMRLKEEATLKDENHHREEREKAEKNKFAICILAVLVAYGLLFGVSVRVLFLVVVFSEPLFFSKPSCLMLLVNAQVALYTRQHN